MRDRLSAPIGALIFLGLALFLSSCGTEDPKITVAQTAAPELVPAPEREWTHLIFLNGHNSLDEFSAINLNQLETVGSSKDVNVVVQWASMPFARTKRLLVVKDTNRARVTSPTLQELPRVDMGDYRQLVDFFAWTVKYFPAKRYFVSLWNHGSGWHRMRSMTSRDINFDDVSGSSMTTRQIGLALNAMSSLIGRKIDVLGSDACLMAMAEINSEVSESVNVAVASEELEPGLGWPYHKLLSWWTSHPTASGAEVATTLTTAYKAHYSPGGEGAGLGDVTLSAMDLSKTGELERAVSRLGEAIRALSPADAATVKNVAEKTLAFDTEDYADLGDFAAQLKAFGPAALPSDAVDQVSEAVRAYVLSNQKTSKYDRATGVSFWLPTNKITFQRYQSTYRKLRFSAQTRWESALESMLF